MPGWPNWLPRCRDSSRIANTCLADGEGLAVVEFESHETAAEWRAHPEHREAQRRGRERWFTEFRITGCDLARDYSFKA